MGSRYNIHPQWGQTIQVLAVPRQLFVDPLNHDKLVLHMEVIQQMLYIFQKMEEESSHLHKEHNKLLVLLQLI